MADLVRQTGVTTALNRSGPWRRAELPFRSRDKLNLLVFCSLSLSPAKLSFLSRFFFVHDVLGQNLALFSLLFGATYTKSLIPAPNKYLK